MAKRSLSELPSVSRTGLPFRSLLSAAQAKRFDEIVAEFCGMRAKRSAPSFDDVRHFIEEETGISIGRSTLKREVSEYERSH